MSSRAASALAAPAVDEAVVGVWMYAAVRHPATGVWHILLPLAAGAASFAFGLLLTTWRAFATAALVPLLALPGQRVPGHRGAALAGCAAALARARVLDRGWRRRAPAGALMPDAAR